MTSINQSIDERQLDIELALTTRDSEALYRLAGLEKEEGNDEVAEDLQTHAKRIDREDMQFDEHRDNQMS